DLDRETLLELQAAAEEVHLSEAVADYAVAIVRASRESPQLSVGASPRGSLALMKLARARACMDGRDFVKPDDVKHVSVPALAHRLTLSPELWVQRADPAEIIRSIVASVPAPVSDASVEA
ncbi:MAG TPA: MoxR family ATPase, partial [Gaiellaceae bacterium]|nr:MoxR family ATPase [Gaiellaceae bacterium]